MTRGKTVIAGLTILMLMGMLVALSSISPIFARELAAQTGDNANDEDKPGEETTGTEMDNSAESSQTVVFDSMLLFGLEEAIARAKEDDIISAEQAAALQDRLDEFTEGRTGTLAFPGGTFVTEGNVEEIVVTAAEKITGHHGPGEPAPHLEDALQTVVDNGTLTQEEADQILADLEAGSLSFVLVSDEGVFTDPADVPASLHYLLPETADPEATVVIIHLTNGDRADIDVFTWGTFAMDTFIDHFGSSRGTTESGGKVVVTPDILADAVAEGLITSEQADAIRSYIDVQVEKVIESRVVVSEEMMPDVLLLETITTRLQQAVESETINQAEADDLIARLTDILK